MEERANAVDVRALKCQSFYFNLLKLLDGRSKSYITSTVFIDELMQTEQCDEYSDLKQLRADYVAYKQKARRNNPHKADDDEWIASCAVAHHGERTMHALSKALDPWTCRFSPT
jgi:hypothetical protein